MARLVAERSDAIAPLAEVFREHGFEGASLALITKATGLGKGSLYHFFPNGKEEMVQAVLADIHQWFEKSIYAPLRTGEDATSAINLMLDETLAYFESGQRVCLVGSLALGNTRDRFSSAIRAYFADWVEALRSALIRQGRDAELAQSLSENAVLSIQGAIILCRAVDDPKVFRRTIDQLRHQLTT